MDYSAEALRQKVLDIHPEIEKGVLDADSCMAGGFCVCLWGFIST